VIPRAATRVGPAGVRRLAVLLLLFPGLVAFDPIRRPSTAIEEGNARMKAGKADEALAAYDKAVAELPAEPGVHFDRGTALAALSRFDEAAEEFLRATEARDPALKAAAFYNLGNAFTKKEKYKEAIEAYKRALALDPKDERAKWNLEIALKKKRDDDKKKDDQKDKNKDKQDKDKQDKDKDKQDKDKDKQDKDKDKDKQDKDKDKQDKGKDKQDKDKQDEDKQDKPKPQGNQNNDQQNQPPPSEKPPAEREIESVLDSLEKSPKDLEKQRAMLRAVRRAPPARDW
jgi:Ca-activated chloride channel homolog